MTISSADRFAPTSIEFTEAGFPVKVSLQKTLEEQIRRYLAIKAYGILGCGETEYRQGLENLAYSFVEHGWSSMESREARLKEVAIFDPRISPSFFIKKGYVEFRTHDEENIDEFPNHEGIVTPSGIYIAQIQLTRHVGTRADYYRERIAQDKIDKSPYNRYRLEECFTVQEGLSVATLKGPDFLLSGCCLFLAGTFYKDRLTLTLYPPGKESTDNKPYLAKIGNYSADFIGIATRGRPFIG